MPEVENLLSEPPAMRPAQSNEYVAARFDELADLLDILAGRWHGPAP